MNKTLDFNAYQRPTLDLTMKDEGRTVIRVTLPKTAVIKKMQAGLSNLQDAVKQENQDSMKALFELAAELMSANLDHVEIAENDIREKYKMDLEDLLIFFNAYLDFVRDLQNAKN